MDRGECATVGSVLSERYRIEAVVGQGAYGRVFLACDIETGEDIALKEFVRVPGRPDSFLREVGILFDLKHKNVIDCRTLLMAGSFRYLVCEYMAGGSLRNLLATRTRRTSDLARLLLDVAAGVEFAHQRNVIHRDLKPENVLIADGPRLSTGGYAVTPKVSDFGISTFANANAETRSFIGSPAYMAPEQFYDRYDARIDIYALGVMLYEILCGTRPFQGSPAQLMHDHIKVEPTYPSWLPKVFVRVLKKALAKKPQNRFASASDFADALGIALETHGHALEASGWPVRIDGVCQLAHAGNDILVRSKAGVLHLDASGRIVATERNASRIYAGPGRCAVRVGDAIALMGGHRSRAHTGVPESACIAVSAFDDMAFVHDDKVAVLRSDLAREVDEVPGVTAVAFAADEQRLVLAGHDGRGAWLRDGARMFPLPERVDRVIGHPQRFQCIATSRDNPYRHFLVSAQGVIPIEVACEEFLCDGDSFFGVTRDGDLTLVDVESGRTARTRWGESLSAVAPSKDRFAVASRRGEVYFL